MPWIRRLLRGKQVFVRTDDAGSPEVGSDGRVDVVYKLAPSAKVYRANQRNLQATGDPSDDELLEADIETTSAPSESKRSTAGAAKEARSSKPPANAVIVWTDGACTGNPGPMGLGAVIIDGEERKELSEYLGEGTNNIAELTAILRAVEHLTPSQRRRPVLIHSDSSYSIGLLTKGWKAKANQELVAELREKVAALDDVRFVKVKGHSGVPENERCDELARDAIGNGRRR